ncbi:hypothetical protein WAK64_20595 [Bacillus spongiae]|uniref:Uncharacterized protein n=1 Tax=Bacillus spongiae TaxID=2683610 RepID=A0ABU8HJU9_9BACI
MKKLLSGLLISGSLLFGSAVSANETQIESEKVVVEEENLTKQLPVVLKTVATDPGTGIGN